MGLTDLTLQAIAFRVLALLIVAGLHGGIVSRAAVLLGDKGPKYDGRLTVVPTGHIDLVGAFSLVLYGLGWGKPVAIDVREFRIGRFGIVVVILQASPACSCWQHFSTPLSCRRSRCCRTRPR